MADGSITIDVTEDDTGVKVGMKEIEASVKRMSSTVEGLGDKAKIAIQKQMDSLTKLNNQCGQQEQKVAALKQRMKELSDQKIETEEYKRLCAEIKQLDNEFEKVEQKQKEWLDMGFSADSMKNLDTQMDEIWNKMEQLEEKKAEMRASGTAYVDPRSLSEYQNTASRLTVEEMRLDDMQNRLSTSFASTEMKVRECSEEVVRSSSKFGRLGNILKGFSDRLISSGISQTKQNIKKLGKALDNLFKKLIRLASGAVINGLKKISSGMFSINKTANKSTTSMSKLLKAILKYGIGIRSVYILFNKFRSAVVEGFQNLAKYDSTGKVNESLSQLKSSLTQLKNSFATAFAPILTAVAPILLQFINLISKAATQVGMLIAALTGQKTFIKAIGVQEDYAASLDKTADSANNAAKAVEGYLSPIDTINRYDDGKDSSSSGSGGYTGPSAGDMFQEVPIESSLKGVADKIKKLIQDEDWEGLGGYMADGINKGLQKVYDAISWDNVGPKVTKFVTAFTGTFNSLVSHIDWDLMGSTLGTGINTAVNTLNLLIGDGGIDFGKIGTSIAKALKGAIREIDWTSLGEFLGNKFMITWKMLSGFVKEMSQKNGAGITGWNELGRSIGKAMTGMFSKISLPDIANALVGVINGAFDILAGFDDRFNWSKFKENLKKGLQTMINGINWKENGKAFGKFLKNLCACINEAIDEDTFYNLGKGIGDFLAELPWKTLLETAAKALIDGLGGALSGMWESEGLPGKIAAGIIVAFGAVKLGTLLAPIKTLVGWIVKKIATHMMAAESTAVVTNSIGTMLNTSLTGATGAMGTFGASVGTFLGTAGVVAVATTVAVGLAKGIASITEAAQGGNGILSQTGGYLHDYTGEMESAHKITKDQAEELWKLIEADESAGKSNSDMYDSFIQKLSEYGVSAEAARGILEQYGAQAGVSSGFVEEMTNKVTALGDGMSQTDGKIDTSKVSLDDLKDIMYQLSLKSDDFGSSYTTVLNQLKDPENNISTAKEGFDLIYNSLKDMGVPLDEFDQMLKEQFPEAITSAQATTKTSMSAIKNTVETTSGAASAAIATATAAIKTDTQKNLGLTSAAAGTAMTAVQTAAETSMIKAQKSVKDSTDKISSDSDTNWKAAEGSAAGSVGNISRTTCDKMQEVYGVVTRYNNSIKGDFDDKWGGAAATVTTAIQNMAAQVKSNGDILASGVENAFSGIPGYIANIMNNAVGKVNSTISSINNSIGGIERGFTFSYNVQLPNGGRRWGNYSLNLPRVNSVPYLASGAVIPPRSEFLAVLGDQKNGRNLEMPESLLRQVVREETPQNTGNNIYNVSVKAAGRNLLDIILEEGEMRRNRNGGKNPFKLDED